MKRLFLFLTLAVLIVAAPQVVLAQSSGYDQFQTGSPTAFNLPGIGTVNFQGVPIGSSTGNADTIIQRNGGGGTFSLSVYALFLKSTSPVTINGQSADLYATINNTGGAVSTSVLPQPDALNASTGTLTITSTDSTGGTFNSNLTIYADLIFVKPGTSVTNPANWIAHQAQTQGKVLVAVEIVWNNTPPPGYPTCLPAGVFYVYKIAGANHPHVVQAAVTQCQTTPAAHPAGGSGLDPLKICVCTI